jgi:hypothetical protein
VLLPGEVPKEGNYRVTVKLGDRESAAVTTIKAELRRLMVEKVETKKGEFVIRTFLVNTRTPKFEGGEVRLKDREKTTEAVAWHRDRACRRADTLHRGRLHVHRSAARALQ